MNTQQFLLLPRWLLPLIVWIFTLFTPPPEARAQNTAEFAPVGAKWWYVHYTQPFGPSSFNDAFYVESQKDTLINGITCQYLTSSNPDVYSIILQAENGIVRFFYEGQFYEIYNFNAEVGDTINLYSFHNEAIYKNILSSTEWGQPLQGQFYVENIFEENGVPAMKIKFLKWLNAPDNYQYPIDWKDTVYYNFGYSSFIIPTYNIDIAENHTWFEINCYEYDDILLYKNPLYNSYPCDYTVSNPTVSDFYTKIYFINREMLWIDTDRQDMTYYIYDTEGQHISSGIVEDKHIYIAFPNGLYFLSLKDKENISVYCTEFFVF
ncbi:MAG: hypothetical protein IPL35_01350 [Sphingobacteriales bacterium]|nr:hypothetical protein [Sphingobacteriales bacterium]